MKALQKVGDFILFSNLFVSLCASAMVVQTYWLASLHIHFLYVVFVFFATLFLYNFQRVILSPIYTKTLGSERHQWIIEHKKKLTSLYILGAIASALCVYFIGIRLLLIMIPLGIISVLYFLPGIHLRKLPAIKAIMVSLVWSMVSVFTPVILNGYTQLTASFWCMIGERFFFVLALCIVFNIRDIKHDKILNVRTIPSLYGLETGKKIAMLSLGISLLLSFIQYNMGAYTTLNLIVLTLCIFITSYLVLRCNEKSSEYYYVFGIDGMMLLPSILICLFYFF